MEHEPKNAGCEWNSRFYTIEKVMRYVNYETDTKSHKFSNIYNNYHDIVNAPFLNLYEAYNLFLNSIAGYYASTALSLAVVGSYLYFNPAACIIEFLSLLALGIISEAIRFNKESIAEFTGSSCDSIEYAAEFMNNSRWSVIGLNAAVTVGSIMPPLSNIVKKPAASFLAILFTHSYADLMGKLGPTVHWWQGTESSNWDKHMKNIAQEGLKNNVWKDTIQFSGKKFVEESVKALFEFYRDEFPPDKLVFYFMENLIARSIASIAMHYFMGESTVFSLRHSMIPLEALFKAADEANFHISNNHVSVTIAAIMNILAKEIFQGTGLHSLFQGTKNSETLNNEKIDQIINDCRETDKAQQAELILPIEFYNS